MPDEIRNDKQLLCGCVAGAARVEELETMLRDAGFINVQIQPKEESREFIKDWAAGRGIEQYVVSATIQAFKPN